MFDLFIIISALLCGASCRKILKMTLLSEFFVEINNLLSKTPHLKPLRKTFVPQMHDSCVIAKRWPLNREGDGLVLGD